MLVKDKEEWQRSATRLAESKAVAPELLADLPATRSAEVLEVEKTRLLGRKAALDLEIRQEREKIGKWTRDHLDLDSLTDKILTQTASSNKDKQELAGLPELPEGFTSITTYLELLRQKEQAREQQDQRLKELKIEQGRLAGAAPAITAEELRAELEATQREFERQQATGLSLLRICEKLQAVIASRGIEDPMQGRATAVQAIGIFAENHQVLFFTCHPEHADQMQSLPRAKNFNLTEWSETVGHHPARSAHLSAG